MTTSIQWCDAVWNPVRGCSLVSAGCTNCYAMKQAHRFNFPGGPYEGLTRLTERGPVWTGKVKLVRGALDAPLHWKKPRRIFVNSMSDLWHEGVPLEFIGETYAVMRLARQHIFQVLTKRPDRRHFWQDGLIKWTERKIRDRCGEEYAFEWPLPNVHEGVSAEDQATADERIPQLLQTPAAVRFVSLEPLLGPINLERAMGCKGEHCSHEDCIPLHADFLHWVIVGGESGPGARPCNIEWVREIVRQCKAAGVAVFVKQMGSVPYFGGMSLPRPHDRKGGDLSEWPMEFRVREFPA